MWSFETARGWDMSELRTPAKARAHVLCLLRDGPGADARRWTEALARSHEVELVDLAMPGLSYDQLLKRIFAAKRVISW